MEQSKPHFICLVFDFLFVVVAPLVNGLATPIFGDSRSNTSRNYSRVKTAGHDTRVKPAGHDTRVKSAGHDTRVKPAG